MKKVVFAILCLVSFQLSAQIPDSLDVDVPWEIVYLPSCSSTMGEGPIPNEDYIYSAIKSDSIYLDDAEECILRIKKWNVLVWETNEVYDVIQIGKIKDDANTTCENEVYLHYEDFPMMLTPEDLLLDVEDGHQYSFSYADENLNSMDIDNSTGDNFELYVYNHTNNTVCKSNIYVTQCEDDVSFVFPDIVDVEFNGEPYLEITLDFLGVDIQFPCGTYSTKILVGSTGNNLLLAHQVGNIVEARVELELSTGEKIIKKINLNVGGVKPPPIPMFIEEKSFLAGETVELDVWSDDILGLVSWGLQLEFENVELLAIEEGEFFDEIPYNFLDENTVRSLWYPWNGLAINVESDASWFTLTLKTDITGNTYDIFKTDLDPWSSIGIEDEDYVYEYEADFIFNVAPRDVLNSEYQNWNSDVTIFPNPATDQITVSNLPDNGSECSIAFYDGKGSLVKQSRITSQNSGILDVSDLPSGLYILKIQNDKSIDALKFIKM